MKFCDAKTTSALLLSLVCALPACSKGREQKGDAGASAAQAQDERGTKAQKGKKGPTKSQPNTPPLVDKGIFSDLDSKISLSCPSWLKEGPWLPVHVKKTGRTWLAVDGVIVCEGAPKSKDDVVLEVEQTPQDRDGDGIPDAVDILRGAKKTVENGATYKNSYKNLAYPGGDVPRTEGVCTDVVIRSLRNTKLDLQELLSEDIKKRPSAYPMVKKADPNIDHRRVRTLLPYFESAFDALPPNPRDAAFPYLPGDIVLMNTMGDAAPEHLGIVSDEVGAAGLPLIINNWTDGTVTRAMDLLRTVPVTHRFRAISPLLVDQAERGLTGVLKRNRLTLPAETQQVLLVTAPLYESSGGTLAKYERIDGVFQKVGDAIQVRLGARGLGEGRGLSGLSIQTPERKREGDRRSPAGVFRLGTAFGTSKTSPAKNGRWPYRPVTEADFWIDDPKSDRYNQWVTITEGLRPQESAERLSVYRLGVVIEHNLPDIVAGDGSAIFLHPWGSAPTTTVGCTSLALDELEKLIEWLDPEKKPLIIQSAGSSL